MTPNITSAGRGRLMNYENIPTIISAVMAVLVAFGAGIKWMLGRMDRQDATEREWQAAERAKLEVLFSARITSLERQIGGQETELHRMQSELTSYVRHVGVLEGLLKANGIDFAYPTLIWWTKDGKMRGCACEKRETYRYVRQELGLKS